MLDAGGEPARSLSAVSGERGRAGTPPAAGHSGHAEPVQAGGDESGLVLLGRISGVYGVRGWIKVRSSTSPVQAIVGYSPWRVGGPGAWRVYRVASGRPHGGTVVAKLEGVDDRDGAQALVGSDVAVDRALLPAPEPGRYYWADLVGLEVRSVAGEALGTVSGLMETGANDVLVVARDGRERLVPFVAGECVKQVDLAAGLIVVDWDADF